MGREQWRLLCPPSLCTWSASGPSRVEASNSMVPIQPLPAETHTAGRKPLGGMRPSCCSSSTWSPDTTDIWPWPYRWWGCSYNSHLSLSPTAGAVSPQPVNIYASPSHHCVPALEGPPAAHVKPPSLAPYPFHWDVGNGLLHTDNFLWRNPFLVSNLINPLKIQGSCWAKRYRIYFQIMFLQMLLGLASSLNMRGIDTVLGASDKSETKRAPF